MINTNLKKIKVASAIVAAFIISISCSQNSNTVEQAAPEFEIKTLDTSNVTAYTEFSTTIQSEDVIDIKPRITGYVDKILKQEGSFVKKGELVLQIADADYREQVNAAKAGVQSATAQLDNSQLEVQKLTPLVEKGIISQFELKTAKSKLEASKALLDQAKAEYENALINLGYTRITSPVNGLLGIISVRVGTLVSAGGEPITTISGLGNISAYFSIDEKLVLNLRNNVEYDNTKEGYVELVLANGTTYSHKGKLISASGIIDRTTGSIQMKVIFPNPETEVLSGSSGVLRFKTNYIGVISIPKSATYELQDKVMAYAVNNDNTVKSVSLNIVGKTDNEYVVDNLNIGDKIVTAGVTKLRDGQTITPKLK
ncbi:MAG: efflux RND transporter periplasmic adaptor subunit [Bacteroidales bacterium]